MTRKTWIQCSKTGEFILKTDTNKAPSGPFVLGDINPYQSMITGEMITGRRQHREHLKQHNCIEVGNEKVSQSRRSEPSTHEYKRLVADVMSSKGF